MIVLAIPMVFPIIVGLGFDPIWFGVVCVILIETGLLTPPFGMNVYVIHSLSPNLPISDVFKGVIPFFIAQIICLTILTVFPIIATWLPSTAKLI